MSKILFFLSCEDTTGMDLAHEYKGNGDQISICLIQNAVYKANSTNSVLKECFEEVEVFAGKEDVEKRGVANHLHHSVKLLNYREIIRLVLDHDKIINL